jgi:hypothetical protein
VQGDEADWTARAADRTMAISRRAAARLTRLRQRPFGLAPGTWQPSPARISSEAFKVSLGSVLAIMTRSPAPRSSMALLYGDEEDLATVLVEVITDFSRGHQDSGSLEGELERVAERDGPFDAGTAGILVNGVAQRVPTLAYRQFRAFRFQGGPALVTVVTRHQVPEQLSFCSVTDLAPFASSLDGDTTAVRDALRQRIRDQARQDPRA